MAAIISSAYFGSTGHGATSIGHYFVSPCLTLRLTISWRWYRECSPTVRQMTPCTIQEATIAPWLLPVYSFRWTVVCALISSMITSIWPTTFAITRYPVIFLPARWLIEPASWATWYRRSVSIGNDRYGGCENFKLQRYARWTTGYFQETT